jgi:hypothetical protein
MKERISHERLLELLDYNSDSGIFTRRITAGGQVIGDRVGAITTKGYLYTSVDTRKYMCHVLAWFYHYKAWPTNQIDHIDRVKTHNWISNLQDVTQNVNQHNRIIPRKDNKSGFIGVSFYPKLNKFAAKIRVNKMGIHLGYHNTPEEAHQAYLNAKAIYHPSFTLEV